MDLYLAACDAVMMSPYIDDFSFVIIETYGGSTDPNIIFAKWIDAKHGKFSSCGIIWDIEYYPPLGVQIIDVITEYK